MIPWYLAIRVYNNGLFVANYVKTNGFLLAGANWVGGGGSASGELSQDHFSQPWASRHHQLLGPPLA